MWRNRFPLNYHDATNCQDATCFLRSDCLKEVQEKHRWIFTSKEISPSQAWTVLLILSTLFCIDAFFCIYTFTYMSFSTKCESLCCFAFHDSHKCWCWDTFIFPLQPLLLHRRVFKKKSILLWTVKRYCKPAGHHHCSLSPYSNSRHPSEKSLPSYWVCFLQRRREFRLSLLKNN